MEYIIPLTYLGWPLALIPVTVSLLLLMIYTTYDNDADE